MKTAPVQSVIASWNAAQSREEARTRHGPRQPHPGHGVWCHILGTAAHMLFRDRRSPPRPTSMLALVPDRALERKIVAEGRHIRVQATTFDIQLAATN